MANSNNVELAQLLSEVETKLLKMEQAHDDTNHQYEDFARTAHAFAQSSGEILDPKKPTICILNHQDVQSDDDFCILDDIGSGFGTKPNEPSVKILDPSGSVRYAC